MRKIVSLLCGLMIAAILVVAAGSARADSDKRVALVVGQSAYQNAPQLRNPGHDADAMAKALKQIGFDVIEVKDANKQKLERAVLDFGNRLASGGIGLFFYSGHGMQVNGKNYLVPIDASLASENAIKIEATDVDLVLDQMADAQTRVNLVILDACRNNPFERRFRGLSRGLASVDDAPKGTLIAYSTSPGKVASDGDGENGTYTQELLKAIAVPGLTAEEVFKRVRVKVAEDTSDVQTPWEASSLTGDFYFVQGESDDVKRARLEAEQFKAQADAAQAAAKVAEAKAAADTAALAQAQAEVAQARAAAQQASEAQKQEAAQFKSQADAAAAEAKAAEAKAAADAAALTQAQAEVVQARTAAEKANETQKLAMAAPAPTPVAPSAPTPEPAPVPGAANQDPARFDGTWSGRFACAETRQYAADSWQGTFAIKGGHVKIVRGAMPQAGAFVIEGDIQPSGFFSWVMHANAETVAVNVRVPSTLSAFWFGNFNGNEGHASGGGRNCSAFFQRS